MACASVVAILVVPASGNAAVTIGSNLSSAATTNLCGAFPCTYWQTELTAPGRVASGGIASPVNGVIVRWRIKAGSSNGALINLRVVRASGASYSGAGTSTAGAVVSTGTSTFAARVPIRIGDFIGLNDASSGIYFNGTPSVGVLRYTSNSFLVDGAAAGSHSVSSAYELLLNADVEADVDADGFGDETQDLCPGDATRQLPPCTTAAPPADTTAPTLRLFGKPKQKYTRLAVTVRSNESGSVGASGFVRVRGSGRLDFKTVLKAAVKDKRAKLKLKFSKQNRVKIKAALEDGKKLLCKVTVSGRDALGNTSKARKTIRLKL
ncbi:MAG TPA: hypothetical protein VGO97_00720 [Solirubrobacterales bacterium]|nr:hypothetical protein [Solirubrobacterales bacterium]